MPESQTGPVNEMSELEAAAAADSARQVYSKLRKERETATFILMRMMDPNSLDAIRKEFFAREDSVGLEEFIYLIEKHLLSAKAAASGPSYTKQEFTDIMFELFKDIDVNGDGDMEWEELTKFIVEKANLLNSKNTLGGIPHYNDVSGDLDASATTRQRNEYSRVCPLVGLGTFAAVEEHSSTIHIFNMRSGMEAQSFTTESFPIAIEHLPSRNLIAVSSSASTLSLYVADDPVPSKRYQQTASWLAQTVQMALAWMPSNEILYSGGNDGVINAWDVREKHPVLVAQMNGHTDIIMCLLAVEDVDNLVSASLDCTICLWDTYTHHKIMKLSGHKKGVFSLSYNSSYRLLISSGFDHDGYVWSPFVKALVYKLKGHHASLIGVHCVEGTDEIITADADGVFKLWDVRNFNCLQSFTSDLCNLRSSKDSAAINCFFHCTLPPVNSHQREYDSRIFAASKMFIAFDQERVVHEATTDFTPVNWICFNDETSVFLTTSEKNLIIWDALLGSRTISHTNIAGAEISCCCLDDRRRKIVVGTMNGRIDVYNPLNAQLMKSCPYNEDVEGHAVVSLCYDSESRRFIAGYANGLMRLYDEGALEDCPLIREYDRFHGHPELLKIIFDQDEGTIATAGSSSEWIKLWDYAGGKMEIEVDACDEEEHLVDMIFLNPLPFFATSDSRGNVVIWGSRSCRQNGQRIAGFLNQAPACSVRETFWHIHNPADRPIGRIYAHDMDMFNRYMNPNLTTNEREEAYAQMTQWTEKAKEKPTIVTAAEKAELAREEAYRLRAEMADDENSKGMEAVGTAESRQSRASVMSKVGTGNNARGTNISNTRESQNSRVSFRVQPGNRGSPNSAISRSRPNSPENDDSTVHSSYSVDSAEMRGEDRKETERIRVIKAAEQEEVAADAWGRTVSATKLAWHGESKTLYTADEHGFMRKFDLTETFALIDAKDAEYEAMMNGDDLPEVIPRNPRGPTTALLPVTTRPVTYYFGQDEVLPSVGIQYVWGCHAHEERMTELICIPHGIVSSGDDKLVKMWDFDGNLIGTLLQSVPIGKRSPQWSLDLDVVSIMKSEEEAVMAVLDEVHELEEDTTQPNIYAMDFSGLQPGAKSAQFSRSELRKRIEMTREVLGIEFPVENEVEDIMLVSNVESSDGDHNDNPDLNTKPAPTKALVLDNSIEAMEKRKAMKAVERELRNYFRGLDEDTKSEIKYQPSLTQSIKQLMYGVEKREDSVYNTVPPKELGHRAALMAQAAANSSTYKNLQNALSSKKGVKDDTDKRKAIRATREKKLNALQQAGILSVNIKYQKKVHEPSMGQKKKK